MNKMRVTIYTPGEMYLNYRFNREAIVANMIGEKIKQIIANYGDKLEISIKKVKHNFNNDKDLPFTTINGLVRCHLQDEKHWLEDVPTVMRHLHENWYDYQIDFEVREDI